ncbi:hypothetical protein [Aurantibacter sp.]|uniref:hypothetical protein n=1 Tax=Aurantibacter sp. TaxID=2807103 RepID=UPI003264917A
MGIIKSLNHTSDKAIDISENYYQKTQEYYKLKIFQQLTQTIGLFCKTALIGSLIFLGIIFLAVSGTLALSNLLNNPIAACLIIAGLIFLLAYVVYYLRARIDAYIIKSSSKTFFD